VRRIEEARPDILLSTGDLVDAELAHVRERAPLLAAVKASMGKFAVLGNHEYYAGLDESLAVNRAAGFQTLRGGSAEAGPFRLVGVDDSVGFRTRAEWLQHEAAALAGAHDGRFVLLLKHRPAFNPDSAGKFDLQLSGHSHGGQIFPFYSVVKMFNPMPLGLSALTGGSRLYHSRGTGTWGPQMRLLSPPEVTLILLEPQ
jgi:predicted MPP superfamily phosphohydrolase